MGRDLFQFTEDVGGNENRASVSFRNIHKDLTHDAHTVGIQTVDRFVENEKRRISKQCHSNADALLHAERAALEFEACVVLHAHDLQHTADLFIRILNTEIDALHHEVLIHARSGETACVLDQRADSDSHAGIGIISAEQLDLTAVGHEMPADQLLGGGFTRTVFPDEAVYRALRNRHVQVVYRIHSAKAL